MELRIGQVIGGDCGCPECAPLEKAERDDALFEMAQSINRTQAKMVSKGKSESHGAILELSRKGVCEYQGVIYSLKREDRRYLASIDDPQGIHGFYGAPSRHEAMTWLVKRIDADLLPLCVKCCYRQQDFTMNGGERRYDDLCFLCEELNQELRNEEWDMQCDDDGEGE